MVAISFGDRNSGLQVGVNYAPITFFPPKNIEPSFFYNSHYEAHKNINPQRVKNTCRWFLDHPTFQAWKSSHRNDLLWVSADPGCGKSVLSRALVDDVLVQDGPATICHFFFKDNEEQNGVATAMCAILHQLFCAKIDLFRTHAENLIRQQGEKLRLNFESLWELWISVALDSSSGDVVCVLDALDECHRPDRDRLIQKLEWFYWTSRERQKGESKLKFLVTSRPYVDIERRFGKLTYQFPLIRLAGEEEWRGISQEIGLVMNSMVDEIVSERRLANKIQEAMKRRFSESDNRTYLWLHLTLEAVRDCLGQTETKILRKIDELPKSVEEAYEEILQRCNRKNERDARRLLEIIVAAQRPLELSEIDVALEIQPHFKSSCDLDLEGSERKQWIRDVCGLFVSVVDSRVYLIHQTAREFLLQEKHERAMLGNWRHSVDLQNAHLALARLCVTYLCFEEFQGHFQQRPKPLTPKEGFLYYSANHWVSHCRQSGNGEEEWSRKAAMLCEIGDGSSSYWISYHTNRFQWHGSIRLQKSSLFWATKWGLVQVLDLLLQQSDLQITDDVVQAAAANEDNGEALIKILIDRRGADLRITDDVVQAAAANWRYGEAVIKILVDRPGADLQIDDKTILLILQIFNVEVISLLLDRQGADLQITDYVVQAATENKYIGDAVMKLLLDRRADLRITDAVVKAAAANWKNGEAVMRLLLDRRGVDVQITNEVVQAAAGNKYSGEAVIRLLLDQRGVDVYITDSIVQAAAANKYDGEAVMKLLLDRLGADLPIEEKVVRHILQTFNTEVISLLLDRRGTDLQITDEVVQAAAANQYSGEAVMKLLLDRPGVEISIEEKVIPRILQTFDTEVISLLLDRRGADIQITDEVVQAAAANQYSGEAVMKLLLDRPGVEISIEEKVIPRILQTFDTEVISLLLDRRGADIQITDKVVQAAAVNWKNGEVVMKLLIDRQGANVQITDKAVQVAATDWKNEEAVMKLLLDRREDLQITDKVVQAAAANWKNGEVVMKLLLDRRGVDLQITDKAVQAAAANKYSGEAVMKLLLDRRGADLQITDKAIEAAAANKYNGEAVMKLLLDRRGADLQITDKAIEAAAANKYSGEAVIKLLLDRRGADLQITHKAVQAATANEYIGDVVTKLLLEQRGEGIKIRRHV